jgi:hypothetical protein
VPEQPINNEFLAMQVGKWVGFFNVLLTVLIAESFMLL